MADTEITIGADTSAFEASMKRITDVAGKAESSISSMFSEFGAQAIAAAASVGVLAKALSESFEGQRTAKQLQLAMAGVGDYTKTAAANMLDFSDSLAENFGVANDTIQQQLALSKTFGASNEQAKQLVETAYDLAAVTGKDVNSVIEQLGATFDGQAGKLKKYVKGIENLTEEQLKAGGAIKLAKGQFEGAFEAITSPLELVFNRLKEDVNNFFEELGDKITKDPFWVNFINLVKSTFEIIRPIISAAVDVFLELFKSFVRTISGFILAITGPLEALGAYLGKDFGLSKFNDSLMATADIYKTVVPQTKDFSQVLKDLNTNAKNAAPEMGKLNKEFDEFAKHMAAGFGGEQEQFIAKQMAAFEKIDSFRGKISKDREKILDELRLKLAIDTDKKLSEMRQKQIDEEAKRKLEAEEAERKRRQDIRDNYIKYFAGIFDGATKIAFQDMLDATTGLAKSTLGAGSGMDAAKNVIKAAAEYIFPGFGELLGAVMNFLTMDTEQMEKFINSFMDAFPTIIEKSVVNGVIAGHVYFKKMFSQEWHGNLIRAWKVATFDTFKTSFEDWRNGLINEFLPALRQVFGAIGNIIGAVIAGIGDLFTWLWERLDTLLTYFYGQLYTNLKKALVDAGLNANTEAQKVLTEAVDKLREVLEKPREIAGGLAEKLGGGPPGLPGKEGVPADFAGKVLGSMFGGTIPISPYSSPYGLDASQLALANYNSTGTTQDAGGFGLAETNQPMIIKSEVKLNQATFAEIILQLSRQNMRMA